ncbi:hypothetical protein [Microbispora sp. H10670]|uniref:hypothetical protein n=1 Tax=Microbispora sp. H10670 TaxID=2729108 RepID=UPI00160383F0|nr:hypothetical protein [Microbispora sp. H10670]
MHDGRIAGQERADVDPLTLAIAGAVATGLATGVGESGGTALPILIAKIRERFVRRPERLESRERLAAALDEEFSRDPAFRRECENLWNQADGDGVVNVFNGQAKTVVQARDVHGGLTIN